jgi:hypothetical protein
MAHQKNKSVYPLNNNNLGLLNPYVYSWFSLSTIVQQMVVNLQLSEWENNANSFHYGSLEFGGK